MDRKGGGARRGPFANKKVPFATRLTVETMDALAAAAERDDQSISQKAEELLLLALRAQDLIDREIGPVIEALRNAALLAVLKTDEEAGAKEVGRIKVALLAAIPSVVEPVKNASPPVSGASQRGMRKLDVGE